MDKQPHVDPEFKALMPPLTQEEYQQLEQNILTRRKCNDAILLWNGTIVDGFNRFCICVTHGIRFEVKEMDFASRDDAKIWIIENQLGRRNLNAAQRIELALCKEEVLRAKARENLTKGGRPKTGDEKPLPKRTTSSEEPIDVRKVLAEADKLYVNIKARLPFEDEEHNCRIYERLDQLAEQIRRLI